MLSSMPVNSVIFSGMCFSGLTNVENISFISPFTIFTAPISVILSFAAPKPVVSMSNTINSPSSDLSAFPSTAPETSSLIKYASTPYIILNLPPFFSIASHAFMASGYACATPWSVIAMAGIPHEYARFIKSFALVTPSIADMFVCKCSSTRFFSALSTTFGMATILIFDTIILVSWSKLSYCAVPLASTAIPHFNSNIPLHFSGAPITFNVIEPVKSVILIEIILFLFLESLTSIENICPHTTTLPVFAVTFFSSVGFSPFIAPPYIVFALSGIYVGMSVSPSLTSISSAVFGISSVTGFVNCAFLSLAVFIMLSYCCCASVCTSRNTFSSFVFCCSIYT